MILEHVTTCAFLQILSAKYQRSVKNFTKRLLVIIFREGVSCLDAPFVISESINHLIERGGKAFLDVRKAFDTVWIIYE